MTAKIGRKRPEEEKNEVPAWIVSFSDMITLLLSFFILLQAFAKERDPELFFVGQGSFKRAIAGLGMPSLLLGRQDSQRKEFRRKRHPAEDETTEKRSRSLDERNAKIRRAIIDKGVCIPDGFVVGYDHETDRRRGFTVTDSGVTVIAKSDGADQFAGVE